MSTSSKEANDDDAVYDYEWRGSSSEQYIFSYGRALEPKYSNPSIAGYYRPWRFTDKKQSGISRIFYARSKVFRIALDVSQFPAENIVVKLVGDTIVVEAYHSTTVDYLGQISRRCVRKYKTPPDLKLHTVTGKHKRGILILRGDRNFEPAEKPVANVTAEDDDDVDALAMSRKGLMGSGRSIRRHMSDRYVNAVKLDQQLKIDEGEGNLWDNCTCDVADETDREKETIIRIRKSSASSS